MNYKITIGFAEYNVDASNTDAIEAATQAMNKYIIDHKKEIKESIYYNGEITSKRAIPLITLISGENGGKQERIYSHILIANAGYYDIASKLKKICN